MRRGLFITGTDTEVGKSWISAGLMTACKMQGLQVAGMKPIASGASHSGEGTLHNTDALLLQKHASQPVDYALINPYPFEPAIAPHLAAEQQGTKIHMERIIDSYRILASQADVVIVEGAGGWLAPVNEKQSMADLAVELDLEVILVVGMRLGCINHALLSAESILGRGARLLGWVANSMDIYMNRLPQNILAIQQRLAAPLLGLVPYMEYLDTEQIAAQLDLQQIFTDTSKNGP